METPNITMDSPSELENTNSLLVSTEIPEPGVLELKSQVSDKPKTQPTLLTKPFVVNTSTPKIELDGLDWLDVKTPATKKPPVVAFDVDKTAKKLATDFKTFEAEKKAFEQELTQFNKIAQTSVQTPELIQKQKELTERGLQLNTTANDLQKTARRVEIDRFELKKTAVRNFAKKAEEGGFFGATWNSIVNGYKTTGLGNARIAIDLGIELLDRIGIPWASKEDMKSMTKDEAKKKVIADMTPIISKGYDLAKTKSTTEEYIEKQKKLGTIPKAWYGAMESANVMASGSKINSFITGSVMGYQAINNEFDNSNDPILRNLDENERKLVSLPIALVNGAIDVVDRMTVTGELGSITGGARAVIAENIPRLAKFTSYVLSKLPKNATAKMITEAAKELAATPTGKMILKATGQLGEAYLVEGTTGGLQAVTDYSFKEIYDATNDMDLFKNPEFFSKEFLGKVAEDFNTEGVGGVMLRSIGMGASALSTATGAKDLSDEAYQVWSTLAQDKDQKDLYLAKIKADLASERITVEEAQNRMTTLKNTVDIASQIPTDLPISSQKEAFGILNNNRLIENEIKELEDYMAGKNPNLVTSVQSKIDGLRNQINKNNTELSKISENAIQEQTTSEVSVQPEAGVSGEMAKGESKAESKVPSEEVKTEELDIENKSKNKDVEIKNISFNKEKTKVNDEGISQLVFEGSFLDNYDLIAQGSESTVYQSKDKSHVIKLSEPYSSKDLNVYEKRVKNGLLKDILGDSGIEVIGYYNYNGTKNPIFRQNYVDGQILTENEAKNYLRNNNKVFEIDNKFYAKYNDVLYRISDFENNLIRDKNGNVVPIDLNISEVKDNNIIDRYNSEISTYQSKTESKVPSKEVKAEEIGDNLEDITTQLERLSTDNKMQYIGNDMPIMGNETIVAEQYLKAKKDGSNPELVSTVESLINKDTAEKKKQIEDAFAGVTRESVQNQTPTEEVKAEEVKTEAPKPESVEGQMGSVFGLNKTQSKAAAVVIDKIAETMASRAGTTKEEILGNISFEKGTPTEETVTAEPVSKTEEVSIPKPAEKVKPTKAAPEVQGPIDTEVKFNDAIDNQVVSWNKFPEQKKGNQIAGRNKNLTKAANDLLNGKISNEQYRAIVEKESPIKPIETFFNPSTGEEIQASLEAPKVPLVNSVTSKGETFIDPKTNQKFEIVSDKVGLRLDLPAYLNNNKWVVTVHADAKDTSTGKITKDKPVSYTGVAKIEDVTFDFNPNLAAKIAKGESSRETKFKMRGKLVPIEGTNVDEQNANAKKQAEAIQNDPSWVQIGANPFRHSYFYNRSTGKPVLSADEVLQIGGLVYAKNVVEANWNDEKFAVTEKGKPVLDVKGNQVYFQDNKAKVSIANDGRFIVTALTDPNVSTPLHEMAHIYEHYLENKEKQKILKWAGKKDWDMAVSEKFSRGFEKYLSEGKSPSAELNKIFENFKKWLLNIYKGIIGSDIDLKLNDSMRKIYAKMLSGEGKPGKAPTVNKILNQKPQTKTVNTMTVLKERIAEIDQAIKEGQRNFKTAVKDIAAAIKAILPKGKFSTSQVKVIVNGMASNLLNPKLREKAMQRIQRVVTNVEEATKLANMYNIRASLKDARKRNLDVNIINMVNNFIDIDPKFIDNFDEYLDYANRVYEASKAIKFVKDEDGNKVLDPRSIENFAEIDEYSKKQLENQEEILKDNLLSQYQSLVDSGALKADMSLQQIKDYIKSLEEDEKNQDDDKDKILMDYAKESFDESKEVLQTYLDDDAIDTEDRELIQGFIDIDINDLAPMQAYEAAEALMNYRVNGSTSKMGKVLANYIGAAGVKDLASQINIGGRVNVGGTRRLRYKAWGKALDALTSLFTLGKAKPNLVETLPNAYSDFWFKYNSALDNLGTTYFGPENWRAIRTASGLNKVVDGNNKKKKIIDDFTKEISDKYKDKKIGDNNVFTQYAMNEIGVIANLYRQTDNPKKANAYFNDRRTILKEYIDYLNSSQKPEERAAGEMMQSIYDKLDIGNAKNGQEIFDNADPVAKDIINDFINKFAGYYPDFARITQQQYNIILGNDRNYTADTWVNVSRDTGNESDKVFNKGFFKSNNIVETEESGRFKEVKFPSHLKKVKGKVVNIPSYDFMQNNINALSETVGDIYTIEGRNQFAGFIDSPYLEQLIQDEDSRKLFTDRAIFDINLLTGNEIIPRRSAFERKVAKGITYIGRAATKAGLSSLESVATQSAPVLLATSFNLRNPAYLAKASKDFIFDSSARDFVNNLKYGIANRGPVSQTSIDYVDNLLANGDYSNADKLLKTLGKATEFLVNTELVGTDVVTAKTSWLAYYMDDLAKQGESPMSIDWATHEVNDKAARYAESMVEKEQNLNTAELSGKLWASGDPRLKIVRSLMPFAGFSVKQKDKVKTNMSTLFKESSLATKEEKIMAARSLVGTMAEQALFNYIKAAVVGTGVGIAYSIVNKKETKEERELRSKRSLFKQIADLFETFNGSMDFFEKEASAQVNNKILDIIENSWDKFAKGKDIDVLDLLKAPKEEKKRKRPFAENTIPKTQARIKRLKLEKELKKKFRFYESADADMVETAFNLFGGSVKVLGNAQWNAFQGILDASKGYFANSDGDKVEYTKKQKEQLRLNIPFYITQIFAPGLIPTNVSRLFKDERKIIQESANMDYQRRKAGRERAKRELSN